MSTETARLTRPARPESTRNPGLLVQSRPESSKPPLFYPRYPQPGRYSAFDALHCAHRAGPEGSGQEAGNRIVCEPARFGVTLARAEKPATIINFPIEIIAGHGDGDLPAKLKDSGASMKTTRSLLVLGGARSGKSRYAQRLAEASGVRPLLIATAQARDAEMTQRIARHDAERGPGWTVVEEPIALTAALVREAREDRIVVVDCATLWLSNLMLQKADLEGATGELALAVTRLAGPAIFVSNEVGQGIVPENRLARAFRDAQGRLNAALAAACEAAVVVIAGIAVKIKPADEPTFRF